MMDLLMLLFGLIPSIGVSVFGGYALWKRKLSWGGVVLALGAFTVGVTIGTGICNYVI